MMAHVLLFLLALSSFGITAPLPRISQGNESESQIEEVESRELACSEYRSCSRRSTSASQYTCSRQTARPPRLCSAVRPRAIVGHRLANGLLAPIRC